MMDAVVVVLILLSLAAGSVVRLRRRTGRGSAGGRTDAPAWLVASSVQFLAADRHEWGQAMMGELDQITDRSKRWRFALGCMGAAVAVPRRRGDAGRLGVVIIAVGAAVCVALVGYGVARYPAILAQHGTRPALITFGLVVAGFVLATLVLARRGAAVGFSLLAGLVIAAVWAGVGIFVVDHAARPAFAFLLLALPLAPLAMGGVGGWRAGTGSAGRQAALLSAVVAGLVLFLVLGTVALVTAGGPYDAGLVRDFAGSGLPDLATYSVSDNLGTAMSLLLVVSTMTAAIGCAGASITARLHPARNQG